MISIHVTEARDKCEIFVRRRGAPFYEPETFLALKMKSSL